MKYDWFVDGHDDQCRGLFVHWYHRNQIEPITLGDPLFDGFKSFRKPDPCISANYIEPNRFLSVPWIWDMLEIDISSHNTSWVTSLIFCEVIPDHFMIISDDSPSIMAPLGSTYSPQVAI